MLFQLIIKHGHVPSDFKNGLIVPVVTDKRKDVDNVDNYKSVTIICVISKLFETCLLNRLGAHFLYLDFNWDLLKMVDVKKVYLLLLML